MATIRGDGIIIATSNSGTTQDFSLRELQLNNFAVSEGIATFTLGPNIATLPICFCLLTKTSKDSYLFSAIQSSDITNNTVPYTSTTCSSSGMTWSVNGLTQNTGTHVYTWNLADSGAGDADLMSGNFTVKAYSLIL